MDNDGFLDDLFTLSVFSDREKNGLTASIKVVQMYPIECRIEDNTVSWNPLTMDKSNLTGTCTIIFQPQILHTRLKLLLKGVQVSKCPITIPDASICSPKSSLNDSDICNAVDFNVKLSDIAQKNLKPYQHSKAPIEYIKNKDNHTKVKSNFVEY